jgi:hypothetical protein
MSALGQKRTLHGAPGDVRLSPKADSCLQQTTPHTDRIDAPPPTDAKCSGGRLGVIAPSHLTRRPKDHAKKIIPGRVVREVDHNSMEERTLSCAVLPVGHTRAKRSSAAEVGTMSRHNLMRIATLGTVASCAIALFGPTALSQRQITGRKSRRRRRCHASFDIGKPGPGSVQQAVQ